MINKIAVVRRPDITKKSQLILLFKHSLKKMTKQNRNNSKET